MAATSTPSTSLTSFEWQGRDRQGKSVRGGLRARSLAEAKMTLRRQGIQVERLQPQRITSKGRVSDKDLALFTRQLAAMMSAGVPLIQSFEIVEKSASNPALQQLVGALRADIETGTPLGQAFRQHPKYFDALFCHLVHAGEQAGILGTLLERLAVYKEKMIAIKGKIKSALVYPIAIVSVAILITTVIMVFVIPSFKSVFEGFGAQLPLPTLIVIAISDFFVTYWPVLLIILVATGVAINKAWKTSLRFQQSVDRWMLRIPILGEVFRKAAIARWARTLSTMFAAGVPLVEALNSVGGAAGNYVYELATKEIQRAVTTGTPMRRALENTGQFPALVVQMVAIGEETGALDPMLNRVADFYENEVDNVISGLSSLMEPVIMVVLGVLIGGLVIAMYMPIFKMGQAI